MIESFIPGRVRLRSPLLRDPATVDAIVQALEGLSGVRKAALNGSLGSLLLEYDSKKLPLGLMERALPLFQRLERLEKEPATARRLEEVKKILQDLAKLIPTG